ncbi:hypothetical protein JTE90_019358 [Oedothorax gibbosus]|uniref:Uncharacterized protein n=1 Tax=Oedothorax gibbosus TaxID=931172 RepID=A0AAV6UK32_9ARAC|nr:hypothetical protein JTE90_019358 [Oedothorax gibbosus]
MALYYKIAETEIEDNSSFPEIQVHKGESTPSEGPCIKYDFSKHVLIELLDNVTPESKLWKALGLLHNKKVIHKRLLVDPHRMNCRRAIVVCTDSDAASDLAKRLTQAKIMKRCVCAIVIQALLSDLLLFEKQIIEYGDKGSQQQLVYVTDLNRPREPASLARYLREKFSPFGTILSVLVSEGEDGYALPEGVIRFAHLSEAFAAELAYDQCAVAMERLSVTTHHNILLSQCDLKARLKMAQLQHAQNSSGKDALSKNPESDVETEKHNSSNGSEINELVDPFGGERPHLAERQELFTTDSEELADVLESSCKENLVDCLKGIATGSETAYTASVASGLELNDFDNKLPSNSSPASSSVAASNLGDKSWSTRVIGWISEIPNADEMSEYHDWGEHRLSSSSVDRPSHSKTCPDEHGNENIPHGIDIVSNSGSYVTCRNGDVNTSFNSFLSSPVRSPRGDESNLNDTTLQADACSSPSLHSEEHQRGNLESLNEEDVCPVPTSLKRKNSSLMTQKLSTKNQRLESSQALSDISETDTTLHLPSTFRNRECCVVLDRLPELTENMDTFKSPVAPKQSSSSNAELPAASLKKSRRGANSTISESSSVAAGSVRSLPVRRVTRRALRQDGKKSSSVCLDNLMDATSDASNSIEREKQNEQESPLCSWLKKELKSSTNNRIPDPNGSTKTVLCATAKTDVLISRKMKK